MQHRPIDNGSMSQKAEVKADHANDTKSHHQDNGPDGLKVIAAKLAILRQGMPICTF